MWIRETGAEVLGWVLVPVGIVMMPAPGPGTLVLVGGVALLSRRYVWAQRLLDPLERKAIEAAKFGVATWPRIFFSFLGGVWLVVLGAIWWASPTIPEFEVTRFTISSSLVTIGFVLFVLLLSVAAVAVLRGLLRSGDSLRIAIITIIWSGGLWFAAFRTPDLTSRDIVVAFGPQLPAEGWATALGIWTSAVAAWGLLAYSVLKWHTPRVVEGPEKETPTKGSST